MNNKETINMIELSFKTLNMCMQAIRESVETIEEFEKGKRNIKGMEGQMEKLMLCIVNTSDQFVRNWNSLDSSVAAMYLINELNGNELSKYARKLSELKAEYDCFKDDRSESLRKLIA